MDFTEFVEQFDAKSLNEAISAGANLTKYIGLVKKAPWYYVPDKEYAGRRYLIVEMGDDEWRVLSFVKGRLPNKKNEPENEPEPETGTKKESMSPIKEILKFQAIAESIMKNNGIVENGNLKVKGNNIILEAEETAGHGSDNKSYTEWVLDTASQQRWGFESCLKMCVGVVQGKIPEGLVPKGEAPANEFLK